MTAHAVLGGSSCYRWANCPGSVALLPLAPPDVETDAAATGTAAHWVLETRLNHWKSHGCDYTDDWPSYAPNGASIYDEMIECVDVAHDYLVDQCWMNWDNVHVEQRVSLSDEMYGTADCFQYSPMYQRLDVYDYKHGRMFVPAVDNHQLAFYMIGAVRKLGVDVKKVTGHIIQPNAGGIRTWTMTIDELYTWWQKIHDAAQRAGEHTFNVGPWCEYCPGTASCDAHWQRTEKYLRRVIAMTELHSPTPQQIAERKTLLDEASTFVKQHAQAVDLLAFHMAENQGKSIPGFKLVQRNTHRKHIDGAIDIVRAMYPNMSDDQLFKPKELKSPAQLDKIIDTSVVTYKPDGGKKLVPSGAAGAAVASKLAEWFNS